MALIGVPTHAKEKYLNLCDELRESKDYAEYLRRRTHAEGFFDGLKAVIPEGAYLIGCDADAAVPDGEGAVFGRVHRSPEDFK